MNFKIIILITSILLDFINPLNGFAALTPEEIIKSIENKLSPPNVEFVNEFTNYRSDGTISIYEVRFKTKDSSHTRGFFLKPEREKGREILRVDDTIWTYVPSVGRSMRIADRDSFAGGDFSNADVLRVDWSNKYSVELLKETENQWIFSLKAKTPEAPYSEMRLWVSKKDIQPVQQYFYDSKGTLLKRCLYGSVKEFGTIKRPARLVMENVITKQKSELKIFEMMLDQKFSDQLFSVDNLGK